MRLTLAFGLVFTGCGIGASPEGKTLHKGEGSVITQISLNKYRVNSWEAELKVREFCKVELTTGGLDRVLQVARGSENCFPEPI